MYNGAYVEMNRVSDNYFTVFANGGLAFNLPTTLQITSVLGDTVFDTLSTNTPAVSSQLLSTEVLRLKYRYSFPAYQLHRLDAYTTERSQSLTVLLKCNGIAAGAIYKAAR